MNNYTVKIVTLNSRANDDLLGVQIGRFCISKDIPVSEVAARLDVSKTTVYKWFIGAADISKHLRPAAVVYHRALSGSPP
jgi:hypothetical protein